MQGAVFTGDRRVELREFADPEPGPGEVVVAIRASGLCGSDLHQYRMPAADAPAEPCIAGHEPAGVVHAVGAGVRPEHATPGDRVMVHHYTGCTMCEYCRSGWPQMCSVREFGLFGTTLHGAHAPYMTVPASTLVPLDDALGFDAGAAIGCGTGTAWGALERLGDVGGATVLVSGQGPVGLSATMLAAARGARVIAVDPAPERRKHALAVGASAVLDPMSDDVPAAGRDLTSGRGAQLAVESSGVTPAGRVALDALAPWGKACFVGIGARIELDVRDYLQRQLTVCTSWSMSIVDQQRCADFIARHDVPVDSLFTHHWRLDEVVDAYAEFDRQSAGKAVIRFE